MIVLEEVGACKLVLITREEQETMSFLPEGYKPEKVEDQEQGEIIKGAAVAVLEVVKRDTEPWKSGEEKDQISFQWRMKTCVEGNAYPNRVVFKKYNMLDGDFATGAETRAKLATDLCTAGYDVDLSNEDGFYSSVPKAVGTVANLRLGEYKKDDKVYQTVKVVTKIKVKGAKKEEVVTTGGVPF